MLPVGYSTPSPFERLIVTEYFDGETSGLARDRHGTWFAFRLLDWSDDHDLRVFALGAVRFGSLDRVALALDDGSRPCSSYLLVSESDSAADLELIAAAEASAVPGYVVVARALLDQIALTQEWPGLSFPPVSIARMGRQSTDWLGQLGFAR